MKDDDEEEFEIVTPLPHSSEAWRAATTTPDPARGVTVTNADRRVAPLGRLLAVSRANASRTTLRRSESVCEKSGKAGGGVGGMGGGGGGDSQLSLYTVYAWCRKPWPHPPESVYMAHLCPFQAKKPQPLLALHAAKQWSREPG